MIFEDLWTKKAKKAGIDVEIDFFGTITTSLTIAQPILGKLDL
jgi:hypothetical protein